MLNRARGRCEKDEDGHADDLHLLLRDPFSSRKGFLLSQPPENSIGRVSTQTVTFERELKLESGRLLGPITLAYETYGTLNADRSNCVWVCHAWTGDAHAAGRHSDDDRKPGWWDDMIGPGKPIDTDQYFVVCSNVIGS